MYKLMNAYKYIESLKNHLMLLSIVAEFVLYLNSCMMIQSCKKYISHNKACQIWIKLIFNVFPNIKLILILAENECLSCQWYVISSVSRCCLIGRYFYHEPLIESSKRLWYCKENNLLPSSLFANVCTSLHVGYKKLLHYMDLLIRLYLKNMKYI